MSEQTVAQMIAGDNFAEQFLGIAPDAPKGVVPPVMEDGSLGLPATGPANDAEPEVEPATTEPEVISAADPDEAGEPDEAPSPDAPVADPAAEPEAPKAPLTKFQIHDAEGEVELPEGLVLSFKANGKEYEGVPLEKVVLMAQMGAYNAQREEEVRASKKFTAETLQERDAIAERLAQYDKAVEALFTDPNYYEELREQYLAEHTPEARATRAEQELAQLKGSSQINTQKQQSAAMTQQTVLPVLNELLDQFPSVSQYEVLGKFSELTTPLLVNGFIPPDRVALVARMVQEDLAAWVRGQALDRDATLQSKVKQATQAEQQKADAAKQEAAKAKKLVARAVAPSRSAVTGAPRAAKPKTYTSAREWIDTAFSGLSDNS